MQAQKAEGEERARQLAIRNKAEVDGLTAIQKLEQDHADFVLKSTLSETDYKKAKIDEWVDASIKSFGLTGAALDRYTAAVRQSAEDQKAALAAPLTEAERHMKDLGKGRGHHVRCYRQRRERKSRRREKRREDDRGYGDQ